MYIAAGIWSLSISFDNHFFRSHSHRKSISIQIYFVVLKKKKKFENPKHHPTLDAEE